MDTHPVLGSWPAIALGAGAATWIMACAWWTWWQAKRCDIEQRWLAHLHREVREARAQGMADALDAVQMAEGYAADEWRRIERGER